MQHKLYFFTPVSPDTSSISIHAACGHLLVKYRVTAMNRLLMSLLLVSLTWITTQASFAQAPPIQWDKTIGGPGSDVLNQMIPTSDGGFLLGGTTNSGIGGDKSEAGRGGTDYWVVKTASDGTRQWDKTIGGPSSDYLTAIVQTPDGGYLIGGSSKSGIGGDKSDSSRGEEPYLMDYWIVKIGSNGSKQWDKTFGGIYEDNLNAIVTTPDGGFLIGGSSGSDSGGDKTEGSGGGTDYWVIRMDANGNKLWDQTLGGSSYDYLQTIVATSQGGFLLGGDSSSGRSNDKSEPRRGPSTGQEIEASDYWVIKISASGAREWDKTLGGNDWDIFRSMIQTDDGGFLLGGESNSGIGSDKSEDRRAPGWSGQDYWVVKIASNGTKQWDKTFGGIEWEYFSTITQTSDGGYLLGGISESGIGGDKTEANKGTTDAWIVKIGSQGIKQWDRALGGIYGEGIASIIQTFDGGYVFGCSSNSTISGDKSEAPKGGMDYWIVKTMAEAPLPAASSFRLNSGGGAFSTPDGRTFAADGYVTGGFPTQPINGDVANTQADALYHQSRHGAFTYALPTGKGTYEVILHFVEPDPAAAVGTRKFNVDIEGSRKLTGYDVFAKAGGTLRAVQESFLVNVTDSVLTIKFVYGSAGIPIVAAIEVVPAGRTFRVNAGGGGFQASEGRAFVTDSYTSGGVSAPVATGEVANTLDDALYLDNRQGGAFSYNFPTGNGNFNVILHFNESYYGNQVLGGVGSRKFKVFLEGTRVLSEYDIFARTGGAMKAIRETFSAQVTDGVLTIYFVRGSAGLATVSAIEVVPATNAVRLASKLESTEPSTQLSLFTNPVEDQLLVNMSQHPDQVRSTQIVDPRGTLQVQNTHRFSSSTNQLEIPVGQLKSGFYLLKVETTQGVHLLKFIKQ